MKRHTFFDEIEDLFLEDGNSDFKYQIIGQISERLYQLPISKVMFLDEVTYDMAESGKEGIFECNMTEILNRTKKYKEI